MAFSQVSTWDGTWEPWTHGTGTEADPFLIENARQLAYLAYRVNNGLDAGGGHVSNYDLHYKLMVDVDLNGSEDFQWTPIGYWNSDADYQCFGGHFDGNNHLISRLYINSSANRVGLFGYSDEATMENLSVSGGTITTTKSYAGGIVGYAGTATITNCYNTGGVSASGNGYIYSGGIVGYAGTATITDCYNAGGVSASGSNTTKYSGGIVGYTGAATITNCYNTGGVSTSGNGYYGYTGGIVGYAGTATITNCYNTGGASSSGNGYGGAGGIVGIAGSANISNSYNVGTTSSTNSNNGGLVGGKNGGTIANSYYLNTCGGNNTYGGQPMSADAMQSAEFVSILNAGSLTFKKDERPYINQGYPIFGGFNIETQPASSIELTSAVLNGSYTSGIFNITSQGFEYKKTTDQSYTTVNCTAGETPFAFELNDLESGATYQYRAFVVANEGKAYGDLVSFTTGIINTHQIYANYSNGPGIITPNGYVYVIDGEHQTFVISAIEQSILDSVCVDGTNVGPVTSYTFHNVNEDHTIYAYSLLSTKKSI